MSRFCIVLEGETRTDNEAYFGYDKPLRTYFLQGFFSEDDDFDEPEIWLGGYLEEFPTMESIVTATRKQGYEIRGLDHAAMIEMLQEAGQKPDPSIGERLGLVR